MEADNIKEGEFTLSMHKTAKKVCMLIEYLRYDEYLRYQCDCQFIIPPTLALCESASTISASSIIAVTANIRRRKFTLSMHKTAKKVSMLIEYLGINTITIFSHLQH
jgi:hypothetical protein